MTRSRSSGPISTLTPVASPERRQHQRHHVAQLVGPRQVEPHRDGDAGELRGQVDRLAGQDQRGARLGELLGDVADGPDERGVAKVHREVLEVKHPLHRQRAQVLHQSQRLRRAMNRSSTRHALQAPGQRPLEQRRLDLAGDYAEQIAHPFFFERLDGEHGMARQHECLDVVQRRGGGHQAWMGAGARRRLAWIDAVGTGPLEPVHRAGTGPVLAPDPSVETETVDDVEQVRVVDLLRVIRFVTARDAADLKVADDVEVRFDRLREVPLHDLHMIEVVLEKHVVGAYLIDDATRLRGSGQEIPRIVLGVQRLEKQGALRAAAPARMPT